ncbi:WD40-repeat-containing domain protein [Blakeslea trispora]|nr:WD40-repeat-containing domain protein [Blakeslea trispora]
MTLLTPSLITPNTSKLLSYLSFNKSYVTPSSKSPDVPTYITIVMRKDGTPTTKYLNAYQESSRSNTLLGRRRALSSQCLSSPKQRRLISSFIPRFHVTSKRSSLTHIHLRDHDDHLMVDKSTMMYRLQQLPIELILHMLMYLDCTSLLRLSETCKQLYSLCQNRYLWQRLFQTDHLLHRVQKTYDYHSLYKNHYVLNHRWRKGHVRTRYLTGHEDSVYCLVWLGPDRIVSGSRDRSIKVWDLVGTRSLVLTKTHHEGSVLCLRISEDARFMVSGSSDATCLIWSLPQFEPQTRLTGHTGGVLDVCIVNECIVSSSRDSSIRVWSQEGHELKRLVGHGGPVNALGSHGSFVVSASGDTTLRLWDIETGHCLRTFIGHTRGLACVRFDGTLIYSGGQDNKLKVWDAQSGKNTATLSGHTDLIRTIDSFENMVVSGSYDKTLKVWDMKENKCALSFQSGHSSWIFNTLLNRTKIISAGQDKRIMIIDFGYDLVTIDH